MSRPRLDQASRTVSGPQAMPAKAYVRNVDALWTLAGEGKAEYVSLHMEKEQNVQALAVTGRLSLTGLTRSFTCKATAVFFAGALLVGLLCVCKC